MLIAVSAMNGRHALSRIWAKHTASLGFDGVMVCLTSHLAPIGSGDPHPDQSNVDACIENGIGFTFADNDPLSGKFNNALKHVMDMGVTRIMILPSDDFISPAWVEAARSTEHDYIIPHACGVVDLPTKRAYAIVKGVTRGMRFGAGRVVSRKAVERCGGTLWPPAINRGLDTASHQCLLAHGVHLTMVPTEGIPITDVKTKDNLWPWSTWQNGSQDITAEEALHMLSPEHLAELYAI